MANKRIKDSEMPCMLFLPKAIREELRYEAFMPWLKAHPFFDFYMQACPVGMRQICASATDEVSMLPLEEIFWDGQSVNRMFFVRIGLVSYCHRDHRISPLDVRQGQWACEETLWSKVARLDGPFRAASAGCELITVLPAEFQSIVMVHPGALRFCVGYAEAFIEGFNSASKSAECEDLLFNQYDTVVAMVEDSSVGEDTWGKLNQRVNRNKRHSVKKAMQIPRASIGRWRASTSDANASPSGRTTNDATSKEVSTLDSVSGFPMRRSIA
jgi:hypothetical protein